MLMTQANVDAADGSVGKPQLPLIGEDRYGQKDHQALKGHKAHRETKDQRDCQVKEPSTFIVEMTSSWGN